MIGEIKVVGTTSSFPSKTKLLAAINIGQRVELKIRKNRNSNDFFAYYQDEKVGSIVFNEMEDERFFQKNPSNLNGLSFEISKKEGPYLWLKETKIEKAEIKQKWLEKANEIGMKKEDAVKRIFLLKSRYGLRLEEIDAVVAYWKAPNESVKDYIPNVDKIIYFDGADRPLYYSLGYIALSNCNAFRYVGIQSTGKNVLVESLASLLYIPLLTVNVQKHMQSEDFEGMTTLSHKVYEENYDEIMQSLTKGKQLTDFESSMLQAEAKKISKKQIVQTIQFVEEALIRSMKNGCYVLFDEVNFAQAHVTARLHSVLDNRQSLNVPGVGEIKAENGFGIFATMNPPEYAGTSMMNKAFESRFTTTIVLAPNEHIDKILENKYPNESKKDIALLNKIYENVFIDYEGKKIDDAFLSLRNYEEALTKKGFGTIATSIEHRLLNISQNDPESLQIMKDIIDMVI